MKICNKLGSKGRENCAAKNPDSVGMDARLAGDEFVVVLENLSASEAASAIAQKITENVGGAGFEVTDEKIRVTTSIGVVFVTAGTVPAETAELLAQADGALYAAKAAGRNTYQVVRA